MNIGAVDSNTGKPTIPPVVAIMMTGVCGFHCPFCYGPPPESRTIDVAAWMQILLFLRKHGVNTLLVSGGEPLLYPGVLDVLRYSAGLGFRLSLATSCPSHDLAVEAASLCDWCELSIHGSNQEVHADAGRSPGNFDVVTSVLRTLTAQPKPRIKVNTVVTPRNASDLESIARLLVPFRVDTWKLAEVRPRGMARTNLLQVNFPYRENVHDLENVRALAKNLMPGLRVVLSEAVSGDKSYVVVEPDGRVLVPNGDQYLSVGTLEAADRWSDTEAEEYILQLNATVSAANVVREFETSFESLTASK